MTTTAPLSGQESNRRTVEAYEGYARRYAVAVPSEPTGTGADMLGRLIAALDDGAHVLDIGSGPGWDADHLEAHGLTVRRTDVTAAFREVQAERGRQVDALDVLTDELGGPYDGVLMLYVMQHIARDATPGLLAKVAGALRPGGVFLLSFREGENEIWEASERSGAYWVVERPWPLVEQQLRDAGLVPEWNLATTDSDGGWRIALARRTA